MNDKLNILYVCGKNKKRSRTAEHIFKNDPRFNVRSAGLSPKSDRKLSAADLSWADIVFVMEADHRKKIEELHGRQEHSEIVVLHIPDEYEFMDEELVGLLRDGTERKLGN